MYFTVVAIPAGRLVLLLLICSESHPLSKFEFQLPWHCGSCFLSVWCHKMVTHSFLLQTQVLGTQFVCAGPTCLCSWLLWWGGIAQQLTHLSVLHWGGAGERSQVCRRSYLCACKGQNLSLYLFDMYNFRIYILMIFWVLSMSFCKDFSEVVLKLSSLVCGSSF